jgi:hypothetical protein
VFSRRVVSCRVLSCSCLCLILCIIFIRGLGIKTKTSRLAPMLPRFSKTTKVRWGHFVFNLGALGWDYGLGLGLELRLGLGLGLPVDCTDT